MGSLGFIQLIGTGMHGNSLYRSRTGTLWDLEKIGVWYKMQFSSTITLKLEFEMLFSIILPWPLFDSTTSS